MWGFLDTIPDVTPIGLGRGERRGGGGSPPLAHPQPPPGVTSLLGPGCSDSLPGHLSVECNTQKRNAFKDQMMKIKTHAGAAVPKRKKEKKKSALPRPSDVGYNSADFTRRGSYLSITSNFLSNSTKCSWIGPGASSPFPARTASSIQPQARCALALIRRTDEGQNAQRPASFPRCSEEKPAH